MGELRPDRHGAGAFDRSLFRQGSRARVKGVRGLLGRRLPTLASPHTVVRSGRTHGTNPDVVVRLVRRKRKASPLDELTPREPVLDALDAVQRVCGTDRTALTGVCAGGIIASVTAAHLAATGQQDQLSAFSLLVTVLDTARAGTVGALVDRRLAAAAKTMSRRRGYLDGRALAEVFAWLRPGDLVWNYWVNNYLLGKKPPAFDVLFWNADTTRMSARLHADFVDLALENRLVEPDSPAVLGGPVDLGTVGVDAYVVAGIADHITPWQNCYRTVDLLGGETRFVLSTSGHIAALVNPPGNPKASYRVNDENPVDPEEWLRGATTEQDSWWPDFVAWLGQRCGPDKKAPRNLGGAGLSPLIEAPGTYVFDR